MSVNLYAKVKEEWFLQAYFYTLNKLSYAVLLTVKLKPTK